MRESICQMRLACMWDMSDGSLLASEFASPGKCSKPLLGIPSVRFKLDPDLCDDLRNFVRMVNGDLWQQTSA